MKHISTYDEHDLFIENNLNEAITLNKDFIKNFLKKKKPFIPIDFAELETLSKGAGHTISIDMPPTLTKIDKKTTIDYSTYEKNLRKKLQVSIKTEKDANNYFSKILNSNKFDKAVKIIIGAIFLSVMSTKLVNYKIAENIAKDKQAKEIVMKLNAIENAKIYSDNTSKPAEIEEVKVLSISPDIKQLMDSIAQRESGNDWKEVNTYGYIGKYQFHDAALKEAGFKHISRAEFMKDPTVWPESDQDLAMLNLLKRNKHIMRNYINKYDGTIINGKKVTESGILAGAHLKGSNPTKDYLDSNGEEDNADGYGTKVSEYINRYSGYNLRGLGALKMRPKSVKKI